MPLQVLPEGHRLRPRRQPVFRRWRIEMAFGREQRHEFQAADNPARAQLLLSLRVGAAECPDTGRATAGPGRQSRQRSADHAAMPFILGQQSELG